jgi:hypothetical protein
VALLAAYNVDEASGNVVDRSGNGRDFALTNGLQRTAAGAGVDATTGTTSATGKGLTKTGGAGSMGLIANPSFLSAAAWTIMFWQQNPGNGVWWLRLYNTAADTGHGFLNVGGTLRLRIRTAAGSNVETSTSPPAADNSWHHYAATYDGTNGRFYLDGVLIGTTGAASSPAAIDRIDIAEHTVANFAQDDVRIYDTALDQATIAALKDTPVTDAAVDVTGAASGAGGGAGTATGTREVVGAAAGAGGGTGTSSGSVEVAGIATGTGGGTGAVAGTREVTAAASGAGGGSGAVVGVRERVGVAAGSGGGVGLVVVVAQAARGSMTSHDRPGPTMSAHARTGPTMTEVT